MAPSKFTTLCLGYAGVVISLTGTILFVFVDSMELTAQGLSSLGAIAVGLFVLNGSRKRWHETRDSDPVFGGFGIEELIGAGIAVVMTVLLVGALALVV